MLRLINHSRVALGEMLLMRKPVFHISAQGNYFAQYYYQSASFYLLPHSKKIINIVREVHVKYSTITTQCTGIEIIRTRSFNTKYGSVL